MKITFFRTVLMTALVMLTACGMEPSGGGNNTASKTTSKNPSDVKEITDTKETPKQESSDALPSGIAQLPDSYVEINTADVEACHGKGKVFNRRTLKCSKTISLAKSFECTESGISEGFVYTGYQIGVVLSAAESDGFVIDQCGETDEGKRFVFLVRADGDGTYSVREIETSVN
jgi:hypothetical protein